MARFLFGSLACLYLVACSDPDASPPGAETGPTGGTGGSSAQTDSGSAGAGGTPSEEAGPGTNNSWGPSSCPASTASVGYSVGETLGELTVVDCDTGEPRSLDELCGAAATWIFTAHSHCPTCKATANFTPSVAAQVAEKNVAIAHILYDDNGTSCATWKLAYELDGLPNVKVYEDPTGAVWSKLKTSNFTAPSVFLDAQRVITHQAHGLNESAVLSQIEAALQD